MDGFIGISKMNYIQIPLGRVLFLCCELIAFLATNSKLLLHTILLPLHWNLKKVCQSLVWAGAGPCRGFCISMTV